MYMYLMLVTFHPLATAALHIPSDILHQSCPLSIYIRTEHLGKATTYEFLQLQPSAIGHLFWPVMYLETQHHHTLPLFFLLPSLTCLEVVV